MFTLRCLALFLFSLAAACGGDSPSGDSCAPQPGDCPNLCTEGTAGLGEACAGSDEIRCQCGYFCETSSLTCAYFEGADAGCSCDGVAISAPGVAALGAQTHDLDTVEIQVIGTESDALKIPRDLEFNPEVPWELWVVNRATPGDERMVVYKNAGTNEQSSTMYTSGGVQHFFAQPSALAFGAPNEFATIHETDVITEFTLDRPLEFMGPVLQTTDRTFYDAGAGGHLDMLHNTPLGMGIAWEKNRVYWIFDGFHSSITRYNFNTDHGPAGTEHEDGNVARYLEGEVKRRPDVPSHMEVDQETGLLYVADTGNNRILVLDITTGKAGATIQRNFDGSGQYRVDEAESWTLVEGADVGMEAPSGLALYKGMVVVSDNQNSTIYAFDLQDGSKVDWLDTELPSGSLMGIDFDSNGDLWLVDALAYRVLRIRPRP